jgi:hypothetical protein
MIGASAQSACITSLSPRGAVSSIAGNILLVVADIELHPDKMIAAAPVTATATIFFSFNITHSSLLNLLFYRPK